MNGVPVTDDTLAINLIDRVGPGGHFLQEDHTMSHFRKVRYSKLFERTMYDQWKEAGSKRFEDRLREITKETMDHQPAPLASDITRELDRMQSHWE
jgi:trimethylamine--corrinoid protein Co-methyltransferase